MFLMDVFKDKIKCNVSGRHILYICVESRYHLKSIVINSRFN